MHTEGAILRLRFASFVLDLDTRQLMREGIAVHLTPKAFQLLAALIAERPKVLSKEALLETLWPATFVEEANLSNLIGELRQALNDRRRKPLWIRTVHGFGYSFCGDVLVDPSPVAPAVWARPACWLEAGRDRFPLSTGEYVIGRDEGSAVRLESASVSRRHARIVISGDGAWLEDLGSKNGTFRGNERVTSAIRLASEDVIRVGSLVLTFHMVSPHDSTETVTSALP